MHAPWKLHAIRSDEEVFRAVETEFAEWLRSMFGGERSYYVIQEFMRCMDGIEVPDPKIAGGTSCTCSCNARFCQQLRNKLERR